MSNCCEGENNNNPLPHDHDQNNKHNHKISANTLDSCCDTGGQSNGSKKLDYILWVSLIVVITSYFLHQIGISLPAKAGMFTQSVHDLINEMAIGLIVGMLFAGIMDYIPKEFFAKVLGQDKGFWGVLRASIAGVILDMCNHGILMVAAKLYNKGVKISQVIAFLVASPWNSLSLTFILWSLIGLKLTLLFTFLSLVVAFITGIAFEIMLNKGIIPENPNAIPGAISKDETLKNILKNGFNEVKENNNHCSSCILVDFINRTILGSKMIVKWILFGTVLASLITTFVHAEVFTAYFGPSLIGLGLTLIAATIIEVCSEGSVPIASQLVNVAGAAGNAFVFLMAGAATDYTEIMILKETTKSWKIPLLLPLVATPQILLLGYIINLASMQ
ncbi:MAG: ATPase [Alphaproteobacteria bacterium]|nr:ATPase [Alphaproteobacteria bacterium]